MWEDHFVPSERQWGGPGVKKHNCKTGSDEACVCIACQHYRVGSDLNFIRAVKVTTSRERR